MARSPLTGMLLACLGIVVLTALAMVQGVPRLDSYDGIAVHILQSNNAGTRARALGWFLRAQRTAPMTEPR